MASYFNLTLDTLAPSISAFTINSGASVTTSTSVTLQITSADAASMKIWGINGVATESAASWETFAATKSVTLPSGDGSKTVYVKVRDSVYNESAASSATITLSTAIPTITITGPDVSVISKQSGKNVATFTWVSDMALKAWTVRLVPANSSAHDAGTQISTTGGSTNMSGTTKAANTSTECKIYGADLATAAGDTDGTYIIKVFGQASANDLWSA
ncbi:MAG: hypothetical protein J6Y20_01060 [Lachnospiraceae bacterium]|nr:hypothetical protein [Lachnospiraceae bacterium]